MKLRRRGGEDREEGDRPSRLVLLIAFAAPFVLVAGSNLAASAQPDQYSSWQDSLSALAAYGASHRGIMTATFVLLGLAHLGTALLFRAAAPRGRITQAIGGVATVAVALLPVSSESDNVGHAVAATVAFVALAVWPALGARREGPPVLHPRSMRTASVVLVLLVVWFGVALSTGNLVGLAERAAALAEALWPLVVVWMAREWGGGGGAPPVDPPSAPPVAPDERPDDWRAPGPRDGRVRSARG